VQQILEEAGATVRRAQKALRVKLPGDQNWRVIPLDVPEDQLRWWQTPNSD
jgi:hypothetical protein